MSSETIGFALLLLGVLLLVAKLVRVKWRLAQKLFLPGSIIGGGIALLLGPDVFGNIAAALGTDRFTEGGLFGGEVQQVWSELPGLLISVVFAGLFLGRRMPKAREAGRLAGPQIAFGLTLSSGQYVLGLLLALLVLSPVFGLPPLTGALIEIGFEGGHGTAGGLGNTFEQFGFAQGQDLALGMATIGLLSGIVIGIVLINWGARKGHAKELSADSAPTVSERMGLVEKENRRSAATLTVHPSSIEPLTLHFGFLALAIIIGQLLLWGLQAVENALWVDTIEIFGYVPLFPLAMLGGILLQFVINRFDRAEVVDRMMIERIQGFALDMLIIAAMGTLSLEVIADNIVPFVLLAACGIAWSLGAFLLLAPRMLPDYWFERGVGDFGQSMGVTATGLILMRIADPELRTPAYPAFGYKQLVLEPFFGGGLVTAAAIPLIVQFGAIPLLVVMTALLVAALLSGLLYFGRRGRSAPAEAESVGE
ncbi:MULTISPECIES: sodium/glutamate symporter [unclassified Actinopolyspora]|uniref:sodium/glutamate symporter n=1 Tax=Actinopolyspora TaxID=1849 RepID=UPI0013F5E1F0|nr:MULTISPECIES: sodium/glutamate symporter [unclassified Actinopolyspora]NHD15593.1 sodium:glutamate symporter [Actinopolyspora sp. BKK2]NHE75194.1 sodium:glutamate symporter [Actinopolyspora sp. BKK1]